MNTLDIEKLVQEITQTVLQSGGTSAPEAIAPLPGGLKIETPATNGDSCDDCGGQCIMYCPKKITAALEAGATRLSAHLGVTDIDQDVARFIDHTLLKPEASAKQITQLCQEAINFSFASVCINPNYVRLCSQLLYGTEVKTCTVIGFPLGANTPEVKSFEAQQAIHDGATEVDMVINIGALKSSDYGLVERDIAMVTRTAHQRGAICKVIIETCKLTNEEKVVACELAKTAGADYVKTSTGFGGGGATVDDVALMRQVVGSAMGVKASGGVRNAADAKNMLAAGATRLGASAGVKIVKEVRG